VQRSRKISGFCPFVLKIRDSSTELVMSGVEGLGMTKAFRRW